MIIPPILLNEEFKSKLLHYSSSGLDNLLDDIITSVNSEFINLCDQGYKDIDTINQCRISIINTLIRFKKDNLNITNDK